MPFAQRVIRFSLAGDLLLRQFETALNHQGSREMGEDRKSTRKPAEEIIAAFDRERAEANELRRRHSEQVRSSRSNDRPAANDHGGGLASR